MSLTLRYAFIPSPNPIRASLPDKQSTIDLQVIISNPGLPVKLREVSIQIGGESAAGTLSTAPLRTPHLPGGWTVEVDDNTLLLTPTQQIDSPLAFTLPQITINATEGIVPITVTEAPPQGNPVKDDTTYSLVKQPADWVVTNFWASPPSLDAVNSPVTLWWSVTTLGRDSDYQVKAGDGTVSEPVRPDDSGRCSTKSLRLHDTTRFELVRLVKDRDKVTQETVAELTVRLDAPTFTAHHAKVSGSIAILQWTTSGAKYCEIYVDGTRVEGNAPADTWESGYPLFLGLTSQPRFVELVAVGTSATSDRFQIGDLRVGSLQTVAGGRAGPGTVAMSPDGTHAYVGADGAIVAVDLATGTVAAMLTDNTDPGWSCNGIAWVPGRGLLAASTPGLTIPKHPAPG